MKLLCISDIHGNAAALERVLVVGHAHRCSKVLVAGDLCFPGPEPMRCWSLLAAKHAHCVQGVSDRAVATIDPEKLNPCTSEECARAERLRVCRDQLGEVILARLARLPTSFRLAIEDGTELLLVHGSPADPTTAITHDMDDREVLSLLGPEPPETVVCGASHVPFDRMVGTTRVINVGSVGEAPDGSYCHAAIVTTSSAGVDVRALVIPIEGGGDGAVEH